MLADNKLGEESDWNYGKLQTLNEDLKLAGFDIKLTGFNETELKEIETKIMDKKSIKEDNFNPEEELESTCKKGDIWQLGQHLLMCGDSTDNEDINKLIKDELIDLIFTDPPYGQIAQKWDIKLNWNDISNLFNELLTLTGQIHIFCKLPFGNDIINSFTDRNFDFWQECIWEKPQFANFVDRRFQQNHENIYLFKRKKSKVMDMTTNLDLVMDEGEPYKLKGVGVSPINGMKRTDKVNETGERYPKTVMKYAAMQSSPERVGHPTQKPLKLCTKFILYGTRKGGKVFDPFGGSGTTLIACQQTNRTCYMMELDPHYCDLIITRWEEFTNQKANKNLIS
jgi:DNA modification methylase